MIPKCAFACLILLATGTIGLPSYATVISGNDTTIGAAINTDATIGSMETKLFSHTYKSESAADRLNRLEQLVFGGISAESSTDERRSRLSAAITVKHNSAPSSVSNTVAQTLTNISSYPRVTQLELRLLGTSYFGEPIAHRLSRLEVHEFGQASTSKDLARRMDTLTAIATSNAALTKYNELPALQAPIVVAQNYRKQFYRDMQITPVAPVKEQPNTVVDQIEYLECTAFGQKHSNKTLQKRVDALEAKYYGEQKIADKNLTLRVAELLALVNNGSAKNPVTRS
jgi:hypothetical protein